MTWWLIVFFTTSMSVEPMPSKIACEEVRQVIVAQYGRGSAFIAASCVSSEAGDRVKR